MFSLAEDVVFFRRKMPMKVDITDSVIQSADDLIGLGLTDCDRILLEQAIIKWIEQFIDDLPLNIEYHFQSDRTLAECIKEAEYQTELERLIQDDELPLAS